MLTGYLVPSSGRIEVAGHDVVTDSLAVRRAISYVPEDAPLYDHMRVGEFLYFMAGIKGLRSTAARKAVDAAAEQLDPEALGAFAPLPPLRHGLVRALDVAA